MGTCDSGEAMKARILRLAGPCISREICHHFTDMTSFRLMRSGGSDTIKRKRQRHSFLEGRTSDTFDVSVKDCSTRIVSCISCCVLRGSCVLWAESILHVATRCVRNDTPQEMHTLRLLTLHIVDVSVPQEGGQSLPDRPPSFVLQSVTRPDRKERLECYPRHMIHFGFLLHAMWNNISSGAYTAVRHRTDTAVLILGLGGNVIGNYLNAALPTDVSIDVVELEPAVLEMCRQQQQVPPLSRVEGQWEQEENVSDANLGKETAHRCDVWSVEAGHERHGHYRFVLGDARDTLRCGKGPLRQQYSMVFLDCYDTEQKCMMHDEDLVDLCRKRLSPGGALVVNAHILPVREELDAPFLSRGFASVQALRVSGYNQTIVGCLAPGAECGKGEFGVRLIRRVARKLSGQFFRNGFSLDADWIKSSRAIESGSAATVRVWEHY